MALGAGIIGFFRVEQGGIRRIQGRLVLQIGAVHLLLQVLGIQGEQQIPFTHGLSHRSIGLCDLGLGGGIYLNGPGCFDLAGKFTVPVDAAVFRIGHLHRNGTALHLTGGHLGCLALHGTASAQRTGCQQYCQYQSRHPRHGNKLCSHHFNSYCISLNHCLPDDYKTVLQTEHQLPEHFTEILSSIKKPEIQYRT